MLFCFVFRLGGWGGDAIIAKRTGRPQRLSLGCRRPHSSDRGSRPRRRLSLAAAVASRRSPVSSLDPPAPQSPARTQSHRACPTWPRSASAWGSRCFGCERGRRDEVSLCCLSLTTKRGLSSKFLSPARCKSPSLLRSNRHSYTAQNDHSHHHHTSKRQPIILLSVLRNKQQGERVLFKLQSAEMTPFFLPRPPPLPARPAPYLVPRGREPAGDIAASSTGPNAPAREAPVGRAGRAGAAWREGERPPPPPTKPPLSPPLLLISLSLCLSKTSP